MFANTDINQLPQNSRQIQPSVCMMGQAHYNQKIEYFCLEDGCQLNRQLCKYCRQQQHPRHKVGRIDKIISPLDKLGRNSHIATSEQDYLFFEEKINQIQREWLGLYKVVEDGMIQLKDGIIMEMTAVKKTFRKQEVDKAHDLLINSKSPNEDIDECVKILNFLDKRQYLDDVEAVRTQADIIAKNVTKIIKKSAFKIGIIMNKMHQNIKKLSFSDPHNLNNSLNNQQSQRKEQEHNMKKEYHDHEDTNESYHDNEAKGQIEQNKRDQVKKQRNDEQTDDRRNERKNEIKYEQREERRDGKANQRDGKKKEEQNKQKRDSQYKPPGNFFKTQEKPKKLGEKLLQNDEDENEEPNLNMKREMPNPYAKNHLLNPYMKTLSKEEDDFRRKKNK